MNVLTLKIFDVLTEKISVLEFENWLYNSKFLKTELSAKSIVFKVVNINYRDEKWTEKLNQLIKEHYCEDYLEILKIRQICLDVIESKNMTETYEVLKASVIGFDYDTDYDMLWKFYYYRDYFGLVDEGIMKIGTLDLELKYYAKQTLELLKNCESFYDAKLALSSGLKPFKTEDTNQIKTDKSRQKNTVTQKIFAFFKKS